MLKNLNPGLLLHFISVDFKIVDISAIKDSLLQVNIHGCYCHKIEIWKLKNVNKFK